MIVPGGNPPMHNDYGFPEKFVRGSLGDPFPFGQINTATINFPMQRSVTMNREIPYMHALETMGGLYPLGTPMMRCRGYDAPGVYGTAGFSATPGFHPAPVKGAMYSPVTFNIMLLEAAVKAQEGYIKNYDDYVKQMFSYDGTLETTKGDVPPGGGEVQTTRPKIVAMLRAGTTKMKQLWCRGIQAGEPLSLQLRKVDPHKLLGRPYSVDATMVGVSSSHAGVVKLLCGSRPHPVSHKQLDCFWPCQLMPVQVADPSNPMLDYDEVEKRLWYYDQDHILSRAKVIRVGCVEFGVPGHVVDMEKSDDQSTPAPPVPDLFCSAVALNTLAATVQVYVTEY